MNASQRNALQSSSRTANMPFRNINHRMPPFPCDVLCYSKDQNVTGFKVFRFSDQKTFDNFRAMTIAIMCVVLNPEDLSEVPETRLRYIYNTLAENETLGDNEIDRKELEGLAFGVIHGAATPFEESKMGTSTAPETGTDAKTKAEARAKEAAEKKAAAAAAKAQAKADAAAKRADGVIGNIKKALDTNEGTTADELLDKLVAKFPDRTRDGMSSTVKIQFSRLAKSTGRAIINAKIVGRGRVYKFADKGAIPGEVEVEAPATPAASATPAATPVAEPVTPQTANAPAQAVEPAPEAKAPATPAKIAVKRR